MSKSKIPGFFKRLAISRSKSSFQNFADDYMSAFLRGDIISTDSGYGGTATQDEALKVSAFWGCLRVLSETFMSVPVFEYRKKKGGDRDKTDETGLFDILHAVPNDEMSSQQFYEMGMYQINLGGYFVAVRQQSRSGKTLGLKPTLWQNTKIKRNDAGVLEYRVKDGQETLVYRRDQVFHVPGPSVNGVTGMSALSFGSAAIKLADQYSEFSQRFFRNAVMASGAFESDGRLEDEPYNRLKEDLKKSWAGLVNTGKPILLEDGLKFKPFAVKLSDAELLSSKKFQVVDICRFLRIPPHMIQDLDRATNNNIEQQSLEFVIYTMLPWFKRWESAINTQLLTRADRADGYFYEFNLAGLIRGDIQARYNAYATGRQWGFLSANDIRRLENMNSIPNGDRYLEPVNMVEAGKNQSGDAAARKHEKLYNEVVKILEDRG